MCIYAAMNYIDYDFSTHAWYHTCAFCLYGESDGKEEMWYLCSYWLVSYCIDAVMNYKDYDFTMHAWYHTCAFCLSGEWFEGGHMIFMLLLVSVILHWGIFDIFNQTKMVHRNGRMTRDWEKLCTFWKFSML